MKYLTWLAYLWAGVVLAYLAHAGPNWEPFDITDIYKPQVLEDVKVYKWNQLDQERGEEIK